MSDSHPIWFHGCIGREEAERRLQTAMSRVINPFLVRKKDTGVYVLSLWIGGQIVHSKITQQPSGFLHLDGTAHAFPDLESVIYDYIGIMQSKGGITPIADNVAHRVRLESLSQQNSRGRTLFQGNKVGAMIPSHSFDELAKLSAAPVTSPQRTKSVGRSRSFTKIDVPAQQVDASTLPKRVAKRSMPTLSSQTQNPLPIIPSPSPAAAPSRPRDRHPYTDAVLPGSEEYDYVITPQPPICFLPAQPRQMQARADDLDDLCPNPLYGRPMEGTAKEVPSYVTSIPGVRRDCLPGDLSSLDRTARDSQDDVSDLDVNPLYGKKMPHQRSLEQDNVYVDMSSAGVPGHH